MNTNASAPINAYAYPFIAADDCDPTELFDATFADVTAVVAALNDALHADVTLSHLYDDAELRESVYAVLNADNVRVASLYIAA